jgi:hypothetical protein
VGLHVEEEQRHSIHFSGISCFFFLHFPFFDLDFIASHLDLCEKPQTTSLFSSPYSTLSPTVSSWASWKAELTSPLLVANLCLLPPPASGTSASHPAQTGLKLVLPCSDHALCHVLLLWLLFFIRGHYFIMENLGNPHQKFLIWDTY